MMWVVAAALPAFIASSARAGDAIGYGAGGGGAVIVGSASPERDGGLGAPGILIIEQYSRV
jgi:hypothetical protein